MPKAKANSDAENQTPANSDAENQTPANSDAENQTPPGGQGRGAEKAKITPVKKLSVATIWGPIKNAHIPPEGEERKICRIAGVAYTTDEGASNFGDWRCLVGEFASTNYETGEIFVSKYAFVPGAMGEALIDGLISAQKEEAGATVKFSVDVSIKVSPRDAKKYEYIVRPVIENNFRNEAVALLSA